jgi:hypothetical protein
LLSKNILENLNGKLLMKNDYEFQIKLITINEKHFKKIDEKLKNSLTFKYI